MTSFVVGLTGGVGSGKSTVAQVFVGLGAGLVDTDAIAHRLTASAGEAMPRLILAFGEEIVARDGSLDRAAMRRKVFADPRARRRLEDILHPMIRAEAQAAMVASQSPYLLYAIPLLTESGGRKTYALDRILLVDCPEELQIERVTRRSGLARAEVEAIMQNQSSRAERLAIADDVLDNSGPPAALLPAIRLLHERYMGMSRERRDGRD